MSKTYKYTTYSSFLLQNLFLQSSVSVLSDILLLSYGLGQCRQVPPNLSQRSDTIWRLLFQKRNTVIEREKLLRVICELNVVHNEYSSSCVYSQCVVHTEVGPCAKGHFIHAGASSRPGVLLLLLVHNWPTSCPFFSISFF
jgi:hypothetical protein